MAEDIDVLGVLARLSPAKRQPNLLLGAVRYLFGTPEDYHVFRAVVLDNWEEVRDVMVARRTQTNEVGRCATLLPLLARLPQPLALLEVGASAGLCLLLDRYRYDYGSGIFGPADSPVVLRCQARGATPVPTAVPEVSWRAGIDLEPVDVKDADAVRWLEALIWPGESDRLAHLNAAIEVARRDPPAVVAGDLTQGFAGLAHQAPADATLVVFHSAVLNYVAAQDRDRFAAEVKQLGAVWVANEGFGVLSPIEAALNPGESDAHQGDFLLSCDGEPVGWTDPHGTWVQWR